MHERAIETSELPHILTFLASLVHFKKLNRQALQDLAESLTIVSIGGGETLIHEGHVDSTLYILLHGRLSVWVQNKEIANISYGQMVGEISLLTNEPRTASVKAIRDSTVLKLSKESFEKFKEKEGEAVLEIAQMAIKRLIAKPKLTRPGENIITIAVAPSGKSNHTPFLKSLVGHLNKIKPTLLMNKERLNAHFGKEIAETRIDEVDHLKINEWLNSLEEKWGYIIYEMDRELSPWSTRCLRQADRLIFVAEEGMGPEMNEIETAIFSQKKGAAFSSYLDLVFLHPQKKASGTSLWLEKRSVDNYHHLRLDSEEDFSRLIRFLTGNAFGVVLNGGGVRGFSHAGVMKAIDEMKLPVDFIGGSSSGALMAAMYVSVGADAAIKVCLEKKLWKASSDYTFPFLSLLRGKNACRIYERITGDLKIEDLWTRFFCTSTNVTQGALEIHTQGTLWVALRASSAIPGIYPPIFNDNGDMLVDGSVLDNMPVKVMRKLLGGGKILAVNCHADREYLPKFFLPETWFSGWKLLLHQWNPFRKKITIPTIVEILRTSLSIAAEQQQTKMEKEADHILQFQTSKYALLDYSNRHEIVEQGYQMTKSTLPNILSKL